MQMKINYPTLYVDIGNTSIKLYFQTKKNSTLIVYRIFHKKLNIIPELYKICYECLIIPLQICIVSVVKSLHMTLHDNLKRIYPLAKILEFNINNVKMFIPENYPKSQLGHDRIITALGAKSIYPDNPTIVVDMGSATTIDIISKDDEFIGGSILPGVQAWTECLNNSIEIFEEMKIDFSPPPSNVGRNTIEGIKIGIYNGYLGGIREVIKASIANLSSKEKVFIVATGGYSHKLKNEKLFNIIDDNLFIKGVKNYIESCQQP